MRLVSPNQMMDAAVQQMLDGRTPTTTTDWQLVVNFFAHNVHESCAHAAVQIICRIFDAPLSKAQVDEIVSYQLTKRAQKN